MVEMVEMKAGMEELFSGLMNLKNEKEQLNNQIRVLNERIEAMEFDLIEAMEFEALESFKTSVGTCSLSVKLIPGIMPEGKEDFYKWAVEHERFDFLQSRLSPAPIIEMFDETNTLPDGISLYTRKTINTRRK